ncbi:MAG: aminomethyl-transferring glycine dehydrogenase subunit GcvPB [Nitrososphaeria archaeon]|nr:aminomethyl-transferring glycine dehydrogenase subunit GcvPB [Nitrososphaeria archaeon]
MFRQARWNEPLLNELSKEEDNFEKVKLEGLPDEVIREKLDIPNLTEKRVIRHFMRLSQMNFGVDFGTYPLGSCTMKYNPKICERIVSNPKLKMLHPLQPQETCQGILQILYELAQCLVEITGAYKASLVPSAGAHGEFVGALMVRSAIKDKGELDTRREMIIPDSAHGTNPASAAMAGFRIVKVPSNSEGLVDIEALKGVVGKRTAGIMLTVPNTLGLFEKNILEIVSIVKEAGGYTYYDGANLNALIGKVRPGDMGFDIIHLNLHKTFATPHGGGGPGSGPVCASKEVEEYLPVPLIEFDGRKYYLEYNRPKSIGLVKGFYGNISVLVKAYAYIRLLGSKGLRNTSERAVVNSNYLLSLLDKRFYEVPYGTSMPRKHEFVVSVGKALREKGVSAKDIAKALIDYGVHAPTIYFPLIVQEALMIEPTETEEFEEIEEYARILNEIAYRAYSDPEWVKGTPYNTSVERIDEAKASHPRTMCLNWKNLKKV